MGSSRPPRTADGDAFRFRAGRPGLDLCSTLLWRYRSPVEQLGQPGDLARWLNEAGLCPPRPAVTEDDLAQARSLREAVYRLFRARLHDQPLPASDAAVVNAAADRPGPAPRLTSGWQVRWVSSEPVLAALAAVGRDCIDLLTGPAAGRLRECTAPDCVFLFVDTSRPGTRQWCSMSRCGNRQRVRDHRTRRAAGSSAATSRRPRSLA